MVAPFVILTGASGAGKTTIAQAIEDSRPEIAVYQGDRIGLPSAEILAGFGHTDEPVDQRKEVSLCIGLGRSPRS